MVGNLIIRRLEFTQQLKLTPTQKVDMELYNNYEIAYF